MVPPPMQSAVLKSYRHGQCDDKSPSDRWIAAAHTAITVVALMEGKRLHVMRAVKAYDAGVRHERLPEEAIRLARLGGLENIGTAFRLMNPTLDVVTR